MGEGDFLFSLWLNEAESGKKYQSGNLEADELRKWLNDHPTVSRFRVSIFARKNRAKETDSNYTGVISPARTKEQPRPEPEADDPLPF